jgi:hypothetical protein
VKRCRPAPSREEDAVNELDRLEAAMSECRELIREAHAATKDLRAAVREARQEARALAAGEVAAHIQAEVSRHLEELGERTGEAVTAATQKVIAEFDRFGEAGGPPGSAGVRPGQPRPCGRRLTRADAIGITWRAVPR